MIQIVGPQFTQWDTGRSVSVSNTDATHIHFANQGDSKAVIIEIKEGLAKIPDYLFQTGKTLFAYAVKDGVTLEGKSFAVRKRERPENYVYEDDQRNYIYELITSAENAVEDANLATQNANNAADKANKAAESWVIVGEARGDSIAINDAIDQSFAGFRIFGKTTQDGVPTPEAPVDLVSVENPTVAVNEQSMLVPYTLHGIPVKTGGNYTDANGQQWVCDEKDFHNAKHTVRTKKAVLSPSSFAWSIGSDAHQTQNTTLFYCTVSDKKKGGDNFVCDRFQVRSVTSATNDFPGICGNPDYPLVYVRVAGVYTLGEFIDWIAENPITIVYQVNEPIETALSEEELAAYSSLHTYRGTTTISNDASAHMAVEYVMDAKKYIDSKIASAILPATVE